MLTLGGSKKDFAQRRMDMNHISQFPDGSILTHQHTHLLNNVSTMGAIGMTTENQAIRTDKELQKTFRLIHCQGLAVRAPEGFLARVSNATFLQLIF